MQRMETIDEIRVGCTQLLFQRGQGIMTTLTDAVALTDAVVITDTATVAGHGPTPNSATAASEDVGQMMPAASILTIDPPE